MSKIMTFREYLSTSQDRNDVDKNTIVDDYAEYFHAEKVKDKTCIWTQDQLKDIAPANMELLRKLIADPKVLLDMYVQNSELLSKMDAIEWSVGEGLIVSSDTPVRYTEQQVKDAFNAAREDVIAFRKKGTDYEFKYPNASTFITQLKKQK